MKICPHCNHQNADNAIYCSTCSANIANVYPVQNQPYQAPAAPYQQQPNYNAQYGRQFVPDSPMVARLKNDIQNAKILGAVSIVFIFFMRLVTFVCSLLGMSKAKAARKEAERLGDQILIRDAKDAYKTNKIALIITIVLYVLAAISTLIVLLLNYGLIDQYIREFI